MNILLVDDNINVLESLQYGIDYKALGIDKVYAALSSKVAKDILLKVPIHIMLTDIEMPCESGIELLQWVNEKGLRVLTMFCTSYASFNYAQKAIELHSFDYYLKPIAFDDLAKRLERAVAKVREMDEQQKYYEYGQYWLDHQKNRKDFFWRRIMHSILVPDQEEIQELLTQQQLNYFEDSLFDIYLFSFLDISGVFSHMSLTMREFVFKNICEEIFTEGGLSTECTIWYQENMAVAVTAQHQDKRDILQLSQRIRDAGKQHLKCQVSMFCIRRRTMLQMRSGLERLEKISRENMMAADMFIFEEDYKEKKVCYASPKIGRWETLLCSGKTQELERELMRYLDDLEQRKELGVHTMKALELDFMQSVYNVLNKNQIEAHRLFYDEEYDYLRLHSSKSRRAFTEYIQYVSGKVHKAMEATQKSRSVVEELKVYIEQHYSEDITRDNLAEIAFLNSDYMARLFKRETGQSVGGYLLSVRMKKAEELLCLTDESIGSIAQQVGYDNFSYFSRLFKRHSGFIPIEYRNKFKKCFDTERTLEKEDNCAGEKTGHGDQKKE
ncbi:MAG: helix-turn-helix domain-containing protein [Lachnospiraceae bacterium]|nr:helix-turn-helix domain-containing protein [Lachnospiraceae bacterium]